MKTHTYAEVKTLRERLQLTQEKFARRLGISIRTLARWETDTRSMKKIHSTALREIERDET